MLSNVCVLWFVCGVCGLVFVVCSLLCVGNVFEVRSLLSVVCC